jgi:hypothetical protein
VARFFSWGVRSREASVEAEPSPARIVETLSASRALPKILAAFSGQPTPVLLDLGPVVGTNVTFLGERLCCKMLIENLREDVETAVAQGDQDGLADALVARVRAAAAGPVDGVLCWDLFDILDRPAAQALASCLRGLLRPKGLLHGFFGTLSGETDVRTKFIIQGDTALKCRQEPAPPLRRHPMQTGEITRLFSGMATVEVLLRKN